MLQRLKTEFKEKVWDNEHVIKARQKFAELDPNIQSYTIIGGFAAFVFILVMTFFVFWGKAISLKNQIAEMDEQIRYVQSSHVKIQELQAMAMSQSNDPLLEDLDPEQPLASYLERATQKSLISKTNVEVSEGAKATADVKLSRISLTQLVRMLYIIEQGSAGTAVERLSVDAKDDPDGYLWATISVRKAGVGK